MSTRRELPSNASQNFKSSKKSKAPFKPPTMTPSAGSTSLQPLAIPAGSYRSTPAEIPPTQLPRPVGLLSRSGPSKSLNRVLNQEPTILAERDVNSAPTPHNPAEQRRQSARAKTVLVFHAVEGLDDTASNKRRKVDAEEVRTEFSANNVDNLAILLERALVIDDEERQQAEEEVVDNDNADGEDDQDFEYEDLLYDEFDYEASDVSDHESGELDEPIAVGGNLQLKKRWLVSDFARIGLNEARPGRQLSDIDCEIIGFDLVRERLHSIYEARKKDASLRVANDAVMTRAMASLLIETPLDTLVDFHMKSMKPSTRVLLSREVITWKTLLEIEAPSDEDLSCYGTYSSLVYLHDTKYMYGGSGTSFEGCGSRLRQYVNWLNAADHGEIRKSAKGQHMRVALQPNAEVHVKLIATFPKTTPKCLVMLNEAIWIDFTQCIQRGFYHQRFHTAEMETAHRNSVPVELSTPDWIGLNHASPLAQGHVVARARVRSKAHEARLLQLDKQTYVCSVCHRHKPNAAVKWWATPRAPKFSGNDLQCRACERSWERAVADQSLDPAIESSVKTWYDGRQEITHRENRGEAMLKSLPWLEAHKFQCPVCYRPGKQYTADTMLGLHQYWSLLPYLGSAKIESGIYVYCRNCVEMRHKSEKTTEDTFDEWVDERRKKVNRLEERAAWLAENNNTCVACETHYPKAHDQASFQEFFGRGFCCYTCSLLISDETASDVDGFMQRRRKYKMTRKTKAAWLEDNNWTCPVCGTQHSKTLRKFQPDEVYEYVCRPCNSSWTRQPDGTDKAAWAQTRRNRTS